LRLGVKRFGSRKGAKKDQRTQRVELFNLLSFEAASISKAIAAKRVEKGE
jgi:hypothetical protein